MNELQSILLSERPLLISSDGYRRLMVGAFPMVQPTESLLRPQTYREESREAFSRIVETLVAQPDDNPDVNITMDYDSQELHPDTVAYHRVWGLVTAASRWYFSSQQLERDLMAAEQNPLISSHLLHVNSPGGEAWYLDRLSATLRQLSKPVVTLYEMCCSAAYHIGCHGSRVYATTQFDFVGCIGTMVSFYDFSDYYARLGIKLVEAKADGSDLKNKMFDNLRKGKPEQYVSDVLNPLNADFLATVRAQRPQLASLADDAPVLRGETFYTAAAQEVGLCDGQRTLEQAVSEAAQMGRRWSETSRQKSAVYNAL